MGCAWTTVSWLLIRSTKLIPPVYSTMALKKATFHTVMFLVIVMPLATAQSLELVYINRPGNNRISLECRHNHIAIASPEIWFEQSDLVRRLVEVVDNQGGRVTIMITQDLEGSYFCSNSGNRSNTLKLIGKKSLHIKYIN